MRKVSDPFSAIKYSERWANERIVEWMNYTYKSKNINYSANQELILADQKSPNIVLFDKKKNYVCVIELKAPSWDVLTLELVRKTWYEAEKIRAPYFATWNINKLVLFSTSEFDKTRSLYDAIVQMYDVTVVGEFKEIENAEHKMRIKTFLGEFLDELVLLYEGKKAAPKLPIDEYFIGHIRLTVDSLANSYKENIMKIAGSDLTFKKKIANWFREQVWSFTDLDEDYTKVARQAAYLLINKILFYAALQEKYDLEPLEIPEGLRSGERLQRELQWFFDQILKIDYETIFTTEFIDEIAFPEDEKGVQSIKDLISEVNKHKISTIGYDFLGTIFENLIPENERHKFGQYFTNADVVDLILKFCLKSEMQSILDPACGAGTFLVRAYRHKRLINPRLKHTAILSSLWGVDVSKFAAHLSTINLAIKDLGAQENYPRIIHSDFFEIEPAKVGFKIPTKIKVRGLDAAEKEVEHPEFFDVIIGNPPYTRQEEMEDLKETGYKDEMIEKALYLGKRRLARISKRAGIYTYFFIHGNKFLKDGGRFGFVVSNSWLDVDYGKGLQEFFLKNYKILAIIGSKVERWFVDADINTCIVILERCRNKNDDRNENYVRFVQLKKPLRHYIPQAGKEWDEELARLQSIENLVKLILGHTDYYENEEIRIFPKMQKDLWNEGFDEEEGKYIGSKWGKYIRAPEVFFKILEKGEDIFVSLNEVADVKRGFTTGANRFFYLTENDIIRWGIEKEFWMHKKGKKWVPNYIIKSPRECNKIVVNVEDLQYRVLMIHKDKKDLKGTNILKYIKWGENQGFHERPTCKTRRRWYDLGERKVSSIFWVYVINDRYITFSNQYYVYCDCELFDVFFRGAGAKDNTLSALLNSSLVSLFSEVESRLGLGLGALKKQVYELENMRIINPSKLSEIQIKRLKKAFDELSKRQIGSVFEEVGAAKPEDVSLDKVEPDRRKLDKIVMGEILGLNEEEQLEVYRAVVDLVKSRLKKAKSVQKKNSNKKSNADLIVKRVLDTIGGEAVLRDLFGKIGKEYSEINLPRFKKEPRIEKTLIGWQLTDGKNRIPFEDRKQCEYCKILSSLSVEKVKIPKNVDKEDIEELREIVGLIQDAVQTTLETITDKKLRNKVVTQVIGKITLEL